MSKRTKIFILCTIILIILFFLYLLLGIGSNKNQDNTPTTTDKFSAQINNNISYNIMNYTFNLPAQNLGKTMKYYSIDTINNDFVKKIAINLGMNNLNTDSELIPLKYEDENKNSISLFPDGNTIQIFNANNPKLKGFFKTDLPQKLEPILNISTSPFYLVSETQATENAKLYTYAYKVGSLPIISDFNDQIVLSVIADNQGNILTLTYKSFFPKEIKEVNIDSLDYIKTNFPKLKKGIYPNFTPNSSNINGLENFDRYEDFEGSIDINAVELGYLWSKDDKNILVPIYKFTCKFHFTSGTLTDGIIIVPAVNNLQQ